VRYGECAIALDRSQSHDLGGRFPAEGLLRALMFETGRPIRYGASIGQALRTLRLLDAIDEHMLDADSRKRRAMRLEISLNGEYADFHAFIPCFHSFTIKPSALSVVLLRVNFQKAQHRGHKKSQRTTEKSAWRF